MTPQGRCGRKKKLCEMGYKPFTPICLSAFLHMLVRGLGSFMKLNERIKKKSKTMEVFATAGTIGMHMVSGPIVGFAIGYGLDKWLGTDPWMKLAFFLIGIGAGFLNVHRDSQNLLRKMQKEGPAVKGEGQREDEETVQASAAFNGVGSEESIKAATVVRPKPNSMPDAKPQPAPKAPKEDTHAK